MIGVVVATHGKLAEEMIRTAVAVVGRLDLVVPVSVVATSPDMRGDLKAAIQRVDHGEGVLLLTDLLGGSPTILGVSFLLERKVEVVTGVNLPMLLKLSGLRASGKGISQIAHDLAEAGQRSIGHLSDSVRRIGSPGRRAWGWCGSRSARGTPSSWRRGSGRATRTG